MSEIVHAFHYNIVLCHERTRSYRPVAQIGHVKQSGRQLTSESYGKPIDVRLLLSRNTAVWK
jgi:hypothetical protein